MGFTSKIFLLLDKFKFLAQTANKTCLDSDSGVYYKFFKFHDEKDL